MMAELERRMAMRMNEAVAYCTDHVRNGGIPFSAFVVDVSGAVLGRGVNAVRSRQDPTAHAEVEAMRDACRSLATQHLHGLILLASCEPCAMCYLCARYAGIAHIYFATDRHEAAVHGFDYRDAYSLFASDPTLWHSPRVHKLSVPQALEPFLEYRSVGTALRRRYH